MLFRVGALGEESGGLHYDFCAYRGPIQLRGILHLEYLEALPFHRDAVVGMGDVMGKIAQHGIVLQQMRERFSVRNVVHGDELDILVVERRAHDVASDAAEAIDADFDGHSFLR